MRGPNDGTGTSSDHASTNSTTWRWQIMQLTDNERTPLAHVAIGAYQGNFAGPSIGRALYGKPGVPKPGGMKPEK